MGYSIYEAIKNSGSRIGIKAYSILTDSFAQRFCFTGKEDINL